MDSAVFAPDHRKAFYTCLKSVIIMADRNKVAEVKDKILEYVKENGPLLPSDISKHMNGNLIFASAILSEFVSNKLLRMSNAKIGGSKLYYFPGQEEKLVMVHKHLPEKPRKAFELLQQQRVVRDSFCEPWERVALREIKDFAVPLMVSVGDKEEVFWKWFTVSDEEATGIIRSALESELPKEEPKAEVMPVEEKADVVGEPKKKAKRRREEQQVLAEPIVPAAVHAGDEFTGSLLRFFGESKVFILEQKLVKRNKEINFVIEFPSVIGKSCYYAKAKSKKKVSDKDLVEAFDEARGHSLPLLFLSNGELTKKAQNFISNHMRGIVFRQV